MSDEIHRPDRRDHFAAWVIFCTTFLAYAFFFQNVGWNQMAHFATIRSLAERGTAEISPFANLTGDVSKTSRGIYSNKLPGIALLGTPIYYVPMTVESMRGIDLDHDSVWLMNLHAMTVLLSSLPAAILNVLIFYFFRREGASLRTAMLLTGAFAFGSLSWPYSGTLMTHMLCACLVFAAWYLLTAESLSRRTIIWAGILIGYGVMCDMLIAPVAVVFAMYLAARRPEWRHFFAFIAGPCAAALALLLYNHLAYGEALQAGPFQQGKLFRAPGLLFGQFGWPQWIRLYWITAHPMRGIFICCPIFLIPLFALPLIRRPIHRRLEYLALGLILLIHIAFYLTFLGWTGGWGVGLRYMIPALALLWPASLRTFERFPKICSLLILLSIFNMLCVTSVNAMSPAPTSGPPDQSNPIHAAHTAFFSGQIGPGPSGHNLMSLMGMRGMWQITPILALLAIYFWYVFTRLNVDRPIRSV